MADLLDKKTRSRIMSHIRSNGTKPELLVKKALRGKGFTYQPKIKGSPDFVNRKKKIAIFVHGCFWHRCPKHYRAPSSNKNYWLPKIEQNIIRDEKNKTMLKNQKYKVITIWEHEIDNNLSKAVGRVIR